MKSILRSPTTPLMTMTPLALVLSGFAAGLFCGALALLAVPEPTPPSERGQVAGIRDASGPSNTGELSGKDLASITLAQELAMIETEAQRELATLKVAKPTKTALPTKEASGRGSTTPALIAQRVVPDYPPLAKAFRFQGPVDVTVRVSEQGYPTKVLGLSGNPMLQKASLEAAKKWRFHPALADGRPVPSEFRIRFEFKLA